MSRFGAIAIFLAAVIGIIVFARFSRKPPADPSETTKSEITKQAERSGTPAIGGKATDVTDATLHFTPEDDRVLRDLVRSGKNAGEISMQMDRPVEAVQKRATELGVELANQ
jgi:hypothetical protein